MATIGQELPVYSGLVEAARANNRQGLPVGAAYLRQASALLTGTILPAASHLYAVEAARLSDNYGTGGATLVLVVLAMSIVIVFALLILTQRYISRISRRVFNVPMLLACGVLAVLALWALIGVISEQNALGTARHDSDSVEVLSASRILLSRAQSDQSLTLVNRGSDDADPIDFAHATHALAPPAGLIGEAQALAPPSEASAASALSREWQAFMAAPTSAPAADRLNANLQGQIHVAQDGFAATAGDAASWLFGLSVAIPVLTAVAATLALLGIRQRLEEYR